MADYSLPARLYAELPSGDVLIPGQSSGCPGPDAFGACPLPSTNAARRCAGATWFYPGERGWRFDFRSESSVCPVAVLDPLGSPAVPVD
jgi:hypothetical protein